MNILIADDHELIRNGIRATLKNRADLNLVGETSDGHAALQAIETEQPDIAILDISMPGLTGVEVLTQIRERGLSTIVIMLSMYTDYQYIDKCLELGVKGYVAEGDAGNELLQAIQSVQEGRIFFSSSVQSSVLNNYTNNTVQKSLSVDTLNITKREREVLKMVAEGLTSMQIAEQIFVSPRTVDTHRANLMRKLEAKNAVELVIKARDLKLIDG